MNAIERELANLDQLVSQLATDLRVPTDVFLKLQDRRSALFLAALSMRIADLSKIEVPA